MTQILASVIIPSLNRPRAVEVCLDALAAQTLPPGSFEVIVVDDGSEPPLALDPKRWAAKFDFKLLHQPNSGPAGARNRGVAEARGEFLAFTDDDCLPTPNWLEKLVAALHENPEALVGGSTFNGLKNNIFAKTSQLILEMVYEHFNHDPANAYFLRATIWPAEEVSFSKSGLLMFHSVSPPKTASFATAGAWLVDGSHGFRMPSSNIVTPRVFSGSPGSTSATVRALASTKRFDASASPAP